MKTANILTIGIFIAIFSAITIPFHAAAQEEPQTGGFFGNMQPVPGVETISAYPIIYINTVNSTPIDQKVTYIDAVAWFDASNSDKYESLGSEDKPLELGIRGRGNASWLVDGPKPYKLKFEKKQPFFGLTKNKHWALLPVSSYQEFYNNMVGYEIGRQIGLPFLPKRLPVQVILNGQFIGIYMLSETLRIDEGRIEIFEQPDENEDEATIPYGWLVEVDNYLDDNQIRFPDLANEGRNTRITYHTPEVLSPKQEEWLYNHFTGFGAAAHESNKLSRVWENFVDIDYLARYFIVQEILHNMDAYVGSWYFHKDKGDEVWKAGPLWDMGWSFDRTKTMMLFEGTSYQVNFMKDITRFPRFLEKASEILDKYMEESPEKRMDDFIDSLKVEIGPAFTVNRQIWPDLGGNIYNTDAFCRMYFKSNIAYVKERLESDLKTFRVNIHVNKENDGVLNENDVDPTLDAVVLVDGLEYNDFDVFADDKITLEFKSIARREVIAVTVNGEDFLEKVVGNSLMIEDINENLDIEVTFGPVTHIPDIEYGDEESPVKERLYLSIDKKYDLSKYLDSEDTVNWLTDTTADVVSVEPSGMVSP